MVIITQIKFEMTTTTMIDDDDDDDDDDQKQIHLATPGS